MWYIIVYIPFGELIVVRHYIRCNKEPLFIGFALELLQRMITFERPCEVIFASGLHAKYQFQNYLQFVGNRKIVLLYNKETKY